MYMRNIQPPMHAGLTSIRTRSVVELKGMSAIMRNAVEVCWGSDASGGVIVVGRQT